MIGDEIAGVTTGSAAADGDESSGAGEVVDPPEPQALQTPTASTAAMNQRPNMRER